MTEENLRKKFHYNNKNNRIKGEITKKIEIETPSPPLLFLGGCLKMGFGHKWTVLAYTTLLVISFSSHSLFWHAASESIRVFFCISMSMQVSWKIYMIRISNFFFGKRTETDFDIVELRGATSDSKAIWPISSWNGRSVLAHKIQRKIFTKISSRDSISQASNALVADSWISPADPEPEDPSSTSKYSKQTRSHQGYEPKKKSYRYLRFLLKSPCFSSFLLWDSIYESAAGIHE